MEDNLFKESYDPKVVAVCEKCNASYMIEDGHKAKDCLEKCPCRCHTQSGYFHCFTPACCESVNKIGEFLRPKRVYEEFKPDPNSFKTFTFPQIKEVWPSLLAKELVDVQPMTLKFSTFGPGTFELLKVILIEKGEATLAFGEYKSPYTNPITGDPEIKRLTDIVERCDRSINNIAINMAKMNRIINEEAKVLVKDDESRD